MRLSLFSTLALFAGPALAAHADTFSFIPANGSSILSFTTTGAPFDDANNQFTVFLVTATNGDALSAAFYSPYWASQHRGEDLQIYDASTKTEYDEDGSPLYTGSESAPVFAPSTFYLTGDVAQTSAHVAGTLIVDGGTATSVTPEPSSFVLMGTGLAGAMVGVRRRFSKKHIAPTH